MSDMKLIMEGWRYQTGKTDFDLLCENFDRGLMNEALFVETWNRRVILESEELFTEGLMDILQQGYQKGKQLAGKAKKAYEAALEKVNDFFLKISMQIWNVVQRIKDALLPVAKMIVSLQQRASRFCKSHPTICKIIKFVVIMLAVSAVAYFIYHQLQQAGSPNLGICEVCTTTGADGEVLQVSDKGIDVLQGMIRNQADDPTSKEMSTAYGYAFEYLDQCRASTDVMSLDDAAGKSGEVLSHTMGMFNKMLDKAQEDPNNFNPLIRYFEKLGQESTTQLSQLRQSVTIGGETQQKTIKWLSVVQDKSV